MMATTSANMCPLDILSKPACRNGGGNSVNPSLQKRALKNLTQRLAGVGVYTVNLSTGEGVHEFEASLVYIENSKPATDLVSVSKQNKSNTTTTKSSNWAQELMSVIVALESLRQEDDRESKDSSQRVPG
jgi:hypothetical protein